MKILISAYACRPNMGSEPAVGWSWITELCKYHDIFVLTNFTNKSYIESYQESHPEMLKNVRFFYIRPSEKLTFWYKEWERFERIYYHIWQKVALKVAKKLNQREKFDCVQHLTYVTCIMPTYMYRLGIPFIYGPIAGGEKIPRVIKYPLNQKDILIEKVRELTQKIPKYSLSMRKAFREAAKIIVVTEDTKRLVPEKYQEKTAVFQAIGIKDEFLDPKPIKKDKNSDKPCEVLIAGRMLAWKGFDLGIQAVKLALQQGAEIKLTVLGDGDEKYQNKLKQIAGEYLNRQIHFVNSVPYEKMKEFYDSFDVLLNCSLRDSGCLVVMEGMSRGLPVICVDTGGPKVNTTDEIACKIQPEAFEKMVDEIAKALNKISRDKEYREKLSSCAYSYAVENFQMTNKIKGFLNIYEEVVKSERNQKIDL